MSAVRLATEQAALCSAVEALGSIAVHMQVITGCWDAARLLRTFWVMPRAETTAQNLEVTVPGIGDSFFRGLSLLSLSSRITMQIYLHNFGVCLLGIFCFNAQFALVL